MDVVEAKIIGQLRDVPQASWDALLDAQSPPFLRWDFLEALESGGCAISERGWYPCHFTLWDDDALIAAAPAYVKGDSAGDFSRDWGWASLIARNGVPYYPKLVLAVPFTPVPGRRILVGLGIDRSSCVRAIMGLVRQFCEANRIHSFHVLFHSSSERQELSEAGMAHRTLFQFHWHNQGYETVDDWLGSMSSKRRNQAKRERSAPAEQGIAIRTLREAELRADPMRWADEVYDFYCRTCEKYMWGGTYLTRDFYRLVFERMPEQLEVVAATRDDKLIAGAFNVATATHLYGRYWGCHEEHRFLHFNVCLYHSIEECIRRGVRVFEGGMGGAHKRWRTFSPVLVDSHHRFLHPELDRVMAQLIQLEDRENTRQLNLMAEK